MVTSVLFMFSSCDLIEPMNNTDVMKLSLIAKEFSKNERNFTDYFKSIGDIDIDFEEEIIKNGDVEKYMLVSKDIERYYENNTLYIFDRLENTKLKKIYRFEDLTFRDNIGKELNKIQKFIQDEYLLSLTGNRYSLSSKTIRFEINAKKIFEEGLTEIEYTEVNVYADFGNEEYLENISVTYFRGRGASMTYETGPGMNMRIDFQENLNSYK